MFSAKQTERFGAGHQFDRKMPGEILAEMRRFETFQPIVYFDRGHPAQGYGHRDTAGPPKLIPGSVWTKEYALQVLQDDLDREFGPIVRKRAKVPISDYMFGALVSLNYNCGPTRIFEDTTIWHNLNAGNYTDCAMEFMTLNTSVNPEKFEALKAAGVPKKEAEAQAREVLKGLTWRRATELTFFMKYLP